MKVTVRNKDEKRPVFRLGKQFPPKSETTLDVTDTEYRALKAVVRLEVRPVPEKPAVKGKGQRGPAKAQAASEPTDEKAGDDTGKE
ncbi:MAG: hypothetical protein HPY55_06570 [Firmicutes bacterium]|nr:hypothetical protein [Bacillota bacterium]